MINWKVRFKNKLWLTSFLAFLVSTVYQFLAFMEVAIPVTEDTIMQVVVSVLQLLSFMGIVVDPTTSGISDSPRAMNYEVPDEGTH